MYKSFINIVFLLLVSGFVVIKLSQFISDQKNGRYVQTECIVLGSHIKKIMEFPMEDRPPHMFMFKPYNNEYFIEWKVSYITMTGYRESLILERRKPNDSNNFIRTTYQCWYDSENTELVYWNISKIPYNANYGIPMAYFCVLIFIWYLPYLVYSLKSKRDIYNDRKRKNILHNKFIDPY